MPALRPPTPLPRMALTACAAFLVGASYVAVARTSASPPERVLGIGASSGHSGQQPPAGARSGADQAPSTGLVAHWELDPAHVTGRSLAPVAGPWNGTLQADPTFHDHDGSEALAFDGVTQSVVLDDALTAGEGLPRDGMSAEAWVAVIDPQPQDDNPEAWGGILGAVQWDSSAQSGWLVGHQDDNFVFALATEGADDGDGRITNLVAQWNFEPGCWHHVVAVYDGDRQRLYQDGRLVASSEDQSGDILYPDRTWFELGAYHDDTTYHRLHGMVAEARLYDRPLSQSEVVDLYGLRDDLRDTCVRLRAPTDAFTQSCTTDNPYFITSCYARGPELDEPALVAFNDTALNTDHYVLATQREVGATYGLAFDNEAGLVYAAAYLKRGTAFGPGGPGMVYRIDVEGGDIEEWLDVPVLGPDPHDRRGGYWPDDRARNAVGVYGLGDIDLSEDRSVLYVMQLQDREILAYDVATRRLVDTIAIGSASEDWSDQARPFGLKVFQGKLYHGVVHSAFASQDPAVLAAYVYESDLNGGAMRQVLHLPLDFNRGAAVGNAPARWQPWRSGYNSIGGAPGQWSVFPQPMLTDIEFTDSHDMILGFRDRNGDMTFFDPGGRNPPGEGVGIPAGDVMLAHRVEDPAGDRWTVQPNPEFYNQDAGPGLGATDSAHDETGFGGLARLPRADVVLTTALTPLRISSGGAYWFDNVSGANTAREELYNIVSDVNFGKANGLGDAEVLCRPWEPTATPTPPHTPTPVVPTPTPTPDRYTIYLPWGMHDDKCIPDALHADVVLVLDRSTSMLRPVRDGGIPKNEAAIAAAHSFVDRLDFTPDVRGRHDQVAVVGFNDDAWTEIDLTSDAAAAHQALDTIATKTQEGTRLDKAIRQGQVPLDGPAHKEENRPVIILLTDGLPNRVPTPVPGGLQEDTVLAAADQVKAKGTRVYTIGLGEPTDILPRMLLGMASDWTTYYYAPRPEDLDQIYDRIAQSFADCADEPAPTPTVCIPDESHTDVVLVLDMSTSMYRETSAGRTKHEAALDAAATFIELLDLEPDGWGRHDQVALVGFNDEAWVQLGLTRERRVVMAQLPRLLDRVQQGTRLDLAFAKGQEVLETNQRLLQNRPVLVLLTDGIPNRVPTPVPGGAQEETVLAVAQRAKDAGTVVFTIGLGKPDDIIGWMLEAAASDPSHYYYAPDGEDLGAIYEQIAGRVRDCLDLP